MIATVLAALRDVLGLDATMIAYLGGDYVKVGWISATTHIPCVTIIENTESSRRRVTYKENRRRDNAPTVQIDIWIAKTHEGMPSTTEDIETIRDRIDELLFGTGVANTRGWERTSTSLQPDGNLFHKALRYDFKYSVQD